MKISFRNRVILTIGALLSIFTGLLVAFWSMQRPPDFAWETPADWLRALSVACGALTAMFGVYLLLCCGRRSDRRQAYVTQKTDNGELRIAVKAIENMVLKCIDLHDEVRLDSMAVQNARSGVTVDLTVSLANNISIPLSVAALQKQIKQYLAASSGVEVREVRVSVQASEEEWEAIPAGADSATPEDDKAVGSRRALHQRLFAPEDQPVILPEPPRQDASMNAWRPPETEFAKPQSAGDEPEEARHAPAPDSADASFVPPDNSPAEEYAPETIDGGSQP